jgi:hypothetical protein
MGSEGEDPLNLGFDVNIGGNSIGQPGSYYGEWGYGWIKGNKDRAVPGLEKYHGTDTHLSDALTYEAIAEIEKSLKEGKPFYLNLAHYAVHHPFEGHKENPGILGNLERHHGQIVLTAGKRLTEQLVPAHPQQHSLVAPEIFLDHVHSTFHDDANVLDVFRLKGHNIALAERTDMIPNTAKHGLSLRSADAVKQRRLDFTHKILHSLASFASLYTKGGDVATMAARIGCSPAVYQKTLDKTIRIAYDTRS